MIPYDDLVAALSSWRAKKGLPVVGAPTAPRAPTPPVGIPRTNPPAPPPMRAAPVAPPPLEPHDDLDLDAMLPEAHYENEGDDFAMSFANATDDQTIAGDEVPAARTSDGFGTQTDPAPAPSAGRKRNDDW